MGLWVLGAGAVGRAQVLPTAPHSGLFSGLGLELRTERTGQSHGAAPLSEEPRAGPGWAGPADAREAQPRPLAHATLSPPSPCPGSTRTETASATCCPSAGRAARAGGRPACPAPTRSTSCTATTASGPTRPSRSRSAATTAVGAGPRASPRSCTPLRRVGRPAPAPAPGPAPPQPLVHGAPRRGLLPRGSVCSRVGRARGFYAAGLILALATWAPLRPGGGGLPGNPPHGLHPGPWALPKILCQGHPSWLLLCRT